MNPDSVRFNDVTGIIENLGPGKTIGLFGLVVTRAIFEYSDASNNRKRAIGHELYDQHTEILLYINNPVILICSC